MDRKNPIESLAAMKFEKIGFDPGDGTSGLNIIEQLNQSFTYLASVEAVKILFSEHPKCAPFKMNLGTSKGNDIVSNKEGGVAAEVFASVRPSNNQKLKKEKDRLKNSKAGHKYVFFMSPNYETERQHRYENSGVRVWSISIPKSIS